jgi:ABC-type Fe3+-hydroxamate transport system substrate-binding protein
LCRWPDPGMVPAVRIRDDLGREVVVARTPARVVSLVPSDTYSLFALGCGDRVVGRTTYCDLPSAVAAIPTVGGTKDVDVDRVLALAPDVVIGNQEENTRVVLERLAGQVPVLVSLPRRIGDSVSHLARLARLLGVTRSPSVVELIRRGYELASAPRPAIRARAFVPIWVDPLMTINADTYGSDVLAAIGIGNCFDDRQRLYPLAADLGKAAAVDAHGRDQRYPRVSGPQIEARAPELYLLPDEPHCFSDADRASLAALATPAARDRRVVEVSGRDLFWYGAWTIESWSRLRNAALTW